MPNQNKEKPILFSAPMVRAILAGSKTQTRRVVKPMRYVYPEFGILPAEEVVSEFKAGTCAVPGICRPGQRLWVRETWKTDHIYDDWKPKDIASDQPILYTADDDATGCVAFDWGKSRPSIFMPRWASRITLEVTNVRVECVQDISDNDCEAEGVRPSVDGDGTDWRADETGWVRTFRQLWDSINKRRGYGWDVNPWVWVYEFKVVTNAESK